MPIKFSKFERWTSGWRGPEGACGVLLNGVEIGEIRGSVHMKSWQYISTLHVAGQSKTFDGWELRKVKANIKAWLEAVPAEKVS